jgi:hypothetical protein
MRYAINKSQVIEAHIEPPETDRGCSNHHSWRVVMVVGFTGHYPVTRTLRLTDEEECVEFIKDLGLTRLPVNCEHVWDDSGGMESRCVHCGTQYIPVNMRNQ